MIFYSTILMIIGKRFRCESTNQNVTLSILTGRIPPSGRVSSNMEMQSILLDQRLLDPNG